MKKIIYFAISCCLCVESAMAQNDTLFLSLEECRNRALATNENIRKSDNLVKQSELDKKIAFSSYLPTVDGSATAIYTKDLDLSGTKLLMHGMWMAGFSLQQVLYAGGRVKNGNDLAEIGLDISHQQQRKSRQEVLLEADQTYWGYVAVLQKIKMLESYVEYIDGVDKSVANSVEAELATKADQLRVNAKLSEIKYNLQKAKNGAELCRLMLCNMIGENFETQVLPADTEINIESPGSLDDNVNDCPDVQLMQMGIKAREKQVKLAKGELLPTLALVGGWDYMGNLKMEGVTEYQGMMIPYTQSFDQSFWYGALSLSVPIWNWGKSCNSVKKAKLEVENAELDLQRNTRLLTIQAKQAVQNVMSGYSLIETAQLGYEQATENLRIMREKYDGNYCTLTDLLDAQSQWQQAECNLIEAKTQYKISESEYLKAIGKLGEKK